MNRDPILYLLVGIAIGLAVAQVFAQLKAGEIKHTEAAELANLAGKMIASAEGVEHG